MKNQFENPKNKIWSCTVQDAMFKQIARWDTILYKKQFANRNNKICYCTVQYTILIQITRSGTLLYEKPICKL